MSETTRKTRKRLPTFAVVLLSIVTTVAALLGALVILLGRNGLAVMEGWLLARWVFVEEDIDLQKVSDGALDGMIYALGDRWSYYIDEELYEYAKARDLNQYVGIGVSVNRSDERGLYIVAVVKKSPAEKAGLLAGEVITTVEGVSAAGEGYETALNLIPGKVGEKRILTVLDETGIEREVTVKLGNIPAEVASGELLDNGVGVVKLENFNTNAYSEFKRVTDELVEQGAEKLVFDMRGNGGGYVDELIRILDYLLPEGTVFQTDPRWGKVEKSKSNQACIDLPFAVLVDENTYSSSELFAAQLRESVGAVIVGEVTSGKGYSQRVYSLLNGGAAGVSTSTYCTGGGVSLIGTGIIPDTVISLTEEQEALRAAGVLESEADPQLQEAIRLLTE